MPKAKKPSAGSAGHRKSPASAQPKLPCPDPVPTAPLWTGPSGEGPNGGVTQGLLHKWLTCRERARLMLVEGLKPADTFSAPLEFGSMWHVCEESFANSGNPIISNPVAPPPWMKALADYSVKLSNKYPFQREEIHGWYSKCAALFPLYVKYWSAHDDVKNRAPLLAEQAFDVPYQLPSGRTVRLRGKWDSVDLVNSGVWLQENKTKGTIDRAKIVRQLTFDLQVMIYLVALQEYADRAKSKHGGIQDTQRSQRQIVHRERVDIVSSPLEESSKRPEGRVPQQRLPSKSVEQVRGEVVPVRGPAEVRSGEMSGSGANIHRQVQNDGTKSGVQHKSYGRKSARDNPVRGNEEQDIRVVSVAGSKGENSEGATRSEAHGGIQTEDVRKPTRSSKVSGTPGQDSGCDQSGEGEEILVGSPEVVSKLISYPIKGIRYNVVRRSAHKSVESMLKKFHEDRDTGRVEEWFARWNVEMTPADVQRFRTRFLDPVLEQLCDWWSWVSECRKYGKEPFGRDHWQSPFSSYSYGVIDGGTDMDEAVMNGSTVGLRRATNLFEELN